MKKQFAFFILGLFFVSVLASCGSSKKGNCDAYGDLNSKNQSELASK